MYIDELSAVKAAKKSSHVKANGCFVVVYFPDRGSFSYYVSEYWVRHDGTWEPYELVSTWYWKGWLKGWQKDTGEETGQQMPSQSYS
jgi:hypothetical protein